jgi:uncharacterized membrane protein
MSANPFDLRTGLFAKHAQHVVLIHFPIALYMAAVGFDFAWQWTKDRALAAATFFNLLVAAIFAVPTFATGLIAWQWALEGQKLKGTLLLHLVLASAVTVLLWGVLWIHWRSWRDTRRPLPGYRLPVELVVLFLVGITAHLGGFLSGVNGTG